MLENHDDAFSELSDDEPLELKIGKSENWDRKLSPGGFLSIRRFQGTGLVSRTFLSFNCGPEWQQLCKAMGAVTWFVLPGKDAMMDDKSYICAFLVTRCQ